MYSQFMMYGQKNIKLRLNVFMTSGKAPHQNWLTY